MHLSRLGLRVAVGVLAVWGPLSFGYWHPPPYWVTDYQALAHNTNFSSVVARNLANQRTNLRVTESDKRDEEVELVRRVGEEVSREIQSAAPLVVDAEGARDVRDLVSKGRATPLMRYFDWNDRQRTAILSFARRYDRAVERAAHPLSWQDRLNLQNDLIVVRNDTLLSIAAEAAAAATARALNAEEQTRLLRERRAQQERQSAASKLLQ